MDIMLISYWLEPEGMKGCLLLLNLVLELPVYVKGEKEKLKLYCLGKKQTNKHHFSKANDYLHRKYGRAYR